MTKVVNFYGGPSAGKSTMAAQLFGWMKARRMNVEYVPEFAKQLTWRKANCLDDQFYVFGNQHHELYTLKDQVDYIVTDSPILMNLHYIKIGFSKFGPAGLKGSNLEKTFEELVISTYMQYDNINFYVERGDRKFVQAGRNQDEETSRKYDDDIRHILDKNWVKYRVVKDLEGVLNNLKIGIQDVA
jgi:nicotinamide riboside kinase